MLLSGYIDDEEGTSEMYTATSTPTFASIAKDEWKRPVEVRRLMGERDICTLGVIKVKFCKAAAAWRGEADAYIIMEMISGGALLGFRQ